MAYKALYRKYRPETFDNVVGQKHIITTLKNAIANNKVAHAYIFSGPRGTGKTTTAKLLAKALNCTSLDNKPCNECENCKQINNGSFPDVIEIDAASNNGVEEIRDLIDKVKYAPIQGKYKIYIIDEVHMLTQGAFNALLKTLEEPPEHVVFILATTDVHKVIPTVLSRCQRFDFSKVSFDDIKNRVEEILKLENITFDDGVSNLVAELADGGMRDALSILDQVVSYAGNHISMQHIYDIYGMMSNKDMVSYLSLLAENKTKDVLDTIENFIGKGIDVKRLTYDLMVCLKDAIVYKETNNESLLERINAAQASILLKYYTIEKSLEVSEILNEARTFYRNSTNYRLFFELASLKIMSIFNTKVTKVSYQQEIPVKQDSIISKPYETRPTIQSQPKVESEVKVTPIINNENAYTQPVESEQITYTIDEYVNIVGHGDKHYKEDLQSKWSKIKEYENEPDKKYIASLLNEAEVSVASNKFILLVYKFKILAQKVCQRNNIILIRRFLKEVFNIDLEVYVLDNSTFIDVAKKYMALRQANKLPELHDIPVLDANGSIKVENKEEKFESETEESGKSLFGNSFKVE